MHKIFVYGIYRTGVPVYTVYYICTDVRNLPTVRYEYIMGRTWVPKRFVIFVYECRFCVPVLKYIKD